MHRQAEVIEYKVWQNKRTGQRVSIGGAMPAYPGDPGYEDWRVIVDGYTVAWPNGTTGHCQPDRSIETVQRIVDRYNARMNPYKG